MPEIVPNLRRDDDEFDEEARSDDDRFPPSLAYNSQTHSPFSSGSRHVTLHVSGHRVHFLWSYCVFCCLVVKSFFLGACDLIFTAINEFCNIKHSLLLWARLLQQEAFY